MVVAQALRLFPDDATLKQMQVSLPAVLPGKAADSESPASRPAVGAMKPITTATIAEIYIEQGLYPQALEVYRELLTSAPLDAGLQRKIAEIEALARGESPTRQTRVAAEAPIPAATPPLTPSVASVTPGTVVLKTLNGWLSAIQARRCRV
jgi:hypothetical protein